MGAEADIHSLLVISVGEALSLSGNSDDRSSSDTASLYGDAADESSDDMYISSYSSYMYQAMATGAVSGTEYSAEAYIVTYSAGTASLYAVGLVCIMFCVVCIVEGDDTASIQRIYADELTS